MKEVTWKNSNGTSFTFFTKKNDGKYVGDLFHKRKDSENNGFFTNPLINYAAPYLKEFLKDCQKQEDALIKIREKIKNPTFIPKGEI